MGPDDQDRSRQGVAGPDAAVGGAHAQLLGAAAEAALDGSAAPVAAPYLTALVQRAAPAVLAAHASARVRTQRAHGLGQVLFRPCNCPWQCQQPSPDTPHLRLPLSLVVLLMRWHSAQSRHVLQQPFQSFT